MSENASIARPYAQAVFEMARDSGNFSNWSEALGALAALAQEPQVVQQYELLRAEAERTIQAQVESALPVSEDHQRRIAEALEKRLGRRVELSVSTDASLIGGAVIRAGDLVIDGSVRARLEKLAAAVSG